ncbi:MAG: transposase [Deltaproteobacteria bacterium]|nr:transposase [Deltaproteobacteria bacterium]
MHIKKNLSFTALRKILSAVFENLPEQRQTAKVRHSLHDVFMSGFAMMHFQDPALLQFQRNLEEGLRQNNLRTIFKVKSIPKDSQLRDIIDKVDSNRLEPAFDDFFAALQREKRLEHYRFLGDHYLVSLDGSGYFSSYDICCPGCLTKESKNGKIRYEHQIVQAAMMHPDMKQVIPLAPEAVKNTDGADKQDCEIKSGKRVLKKIRKSHPKLPIIIAGDGLYSKQPFIEEIKAGMMSYILVAKPDDHKIMMEWVNEQRQLKEVSRMESRDIKGRTHVYEWINEVPLNGNKETVMTNYFEYWLIDKGKVGYHNSWVTDIPISKKNISELVRGGRCRWKIENETFNTLKNQGYHIEHNFGHGKKNLSMNFFLLNMLAFFAHQILELTDNLYQECRKAFGSKRNLWDHLRVSIRLLIFPDWETLLLRILRPSGFI